jgi:hypothetical protein
MDYNKFKKEYESFDLYMSDYRSQFDTEGYLRQLEGPHAVNDDWLDFPTAEGDHCTSYAQDDRVNSPSHYTGGRVEAIDVIEDAIKDAPNPTVGMLQAQVLKYLLRLWLKDNPVEDAKKARWYLDRLITKLDSAR